MNLKGLNFILSNHMSDYDTVERSWRERFFSLPWKPWKSTKQVYNPKLLKFGNDIVCSPLAFQQISKHAIKTEWDDKPIFTKSNS